MEALRDLSWIRQLSLPAVEHIELRGFRVAIVTVPPTPAHHADRFRYRLLAIDPAMGRPVLSVDLESDILGDYCLSVQLASEHRILARFDRLPTVEEFRERALSEAMQRLPQQAGIAGPEGQLPRTALPSKPARGKQHPRPH